MLINPVKKWGTELNREFSADEVQMTKRHLRSCSTSLAISEMQIKTTLRYHLTPVRIAKLKNSNDSLCWRGCGLRGTIIHCWWECKLWSHFENQCVGFSGNWESTYLRTQQFHSWEYTQERPYHTTTAFVQQCS